MIVATDGSGLSRGSPKAGGGIAYYHNGKLYSIHIKVPDRNILDIHVGDKITFVLGDKYCKPTNNRGELLSALLVKIVIDFYHPEMSKSKHRILTDSEYTMRFFTGKWATYPTEDEMGKKINGDLGLLVWKYYKGVNNYYIRHIEAHVPESKWPSQKRPLDHELNNYADKAADYRLNDAVPEGIISIY